MLVVIAQYQRNFLIWEISFDCFGDELNRVFDARFTCCPTKMIGKITGVINPVDFLTNKDRQNDQFYMENPFNNLKTNFMIWSHLWTNFLNQISWRITHMKIAPFSRLFCWIRFGLESVIWIHHMNFHHDVVMVLTVLSLRQQIGSMHLELLPAA